VNGEVSTTVSYSQRVQVKQFEPAEVFVSMTVTPDMTVEQMEQLVATNAIAYELVQGEVLKRVEAILNPPKEEVPEPEWGDAPAQAKPSPSLTARNYADRLGFSEAEWEDFIEACKNVGKDPVNTFLIGWADSCTTHDEFIRFATTGEKPKNAKPRLEVAK